MDKLVAIRTFRAVVEQGSFTGAARWLDSSNGAVSKRVADLEADLGVTLIHRTTRRIAITDAGRAYYAQCCQVLDDLDEVETALSAEQSTPRGHLRVNCPMSLGLLHVVPLMPDFRARYPEVSVELTMNDRRVELVEGGFDVALRAGDRLADSTLVARRIAPITRVLCASPAYIERWGSPAVPEDVAGHACLVYSLGAEPGVWPFQRDGRRHEVRVGGPLVANSSIALRDWLLRDMGVSLMPNFVVAEDLVAGRLVELLPEYRAATQHLFVLYPSHRHLSLKVRVFIDFMVERIGGGWG